jgi:hypothetical protein
MRNDRTLHMLLAAIAVLLGVNLLVTTNPERTARAAAATSFDPATNLAQAQIEQLTKLGEKVDKLQAYLESGKLAVIVKELPKPEK